MSDRHPVYLLLGPEVGEKEAFVSKLLASLARETGGEPEVHRFYAFDADISQVLTVLRNGSLFSAHRVVMLAGVEQINRKGDLEALREYSGRPAPEATLLLLSDEVGRVDKALRGFVPKPAQKTFWELFESQKRGWIASFLRRHDIQAEPDAVEFLLEMVENNTKQLRETCEKLVLFFGAGARIRYEEIEKLIYHSKDENVYSLFDRLARRDLGGAVEVLHRILLAREVEPTQLLAGLASQFRRLTAYRQLLAERFGREEALQRAGIRGGKRVQRVYQEASERYSLAQLRAVMVVLADSDVGLRSHKTALHPTLLDLCLYRIVNPQARGPQSAA